MKILYLIPTLDIGGAEIDLVRLLPRLDRSRYQATVWPFIHRGPLADQIEAADIGVWPPIFSQTVAEAAQKSEASASQARFIRMRRMRRFPAAAWYSGRLAATITSRIRAADIDVVHAILPNAYVLGAVSSLIGRHPLVMSRLSQNWYHRQMPLFGAIERQLAHRTVRIAIANNSVSLDELHAEGIPDHKLRLVYNGIDHQEFRSRQVDRATARGQLGITESTLMLCAVANLHPYKGLADLFNALAMVREAFPADWCLLVAGRDVAGQMAVLTDLATRLGLSRHIRLLGERMDVPLILSAADIHVSASHTEGFPNNTLEAMCAGLPIVATNVGGVGEQIENGQSGILTRPRDVPDMAAALRTLASDRDMRLRLGLNGGERVQRFSLERTVRAHEEIYEGMSLQGRRRGVSRS